MGRDIFTKGWGGISFRRGREGYFYKGLGDMFTMELGGIFLQMGGGYLHKGVGDILTME